MSGAEIATCAVAEIFADPEFAALLAEYAPECSNPLLGRTAPDRAAYEGLEALGAGQCLSARLDGRLCGFAFLLVGPMPHYGRRFGTVESLFVAPAARPRGVGWLLMEAVEAQARKRGAEAILYSAPVGSQLERLLSLVGDRYQLTNFVFTGEL